MWAPLPPPQYQTALHGDKRLLGRAWASPTWLFSQDVCLCQLTSLCPQAPCHTGQFLGGRVSCCNVKRLWVRASQRLLLFLFFFKLNRCAKWEEAVDSHLAALWRCNHVNTDVDYVVPKMRIVPANTKPLFCRITYSHAQDSHPVRWAGSTNTCTPSAIVH